MAGELSEAFEQHLRSLSDSDWDALASRVRTPQAPPPGQQYDEEQRREREYNGGTRRFGRGGKAEGLEAAYLRGYIDEQGKPIKGENQ